MKFILFFLISLISFSASSQIALINDKDGYTNLRTEPNSNSEIIHKIMEGQVFWFDEEYFDNTMDWVTVYFPKNKYSITCSSHELIVGYVHKSRIMPISELESSNSLLFEYELKTFSEKGKIIEYQNGKWIETINGLRPWGIDGNKPKVEVGRITVKLEGKVIFVPELLTMDIFECTNSFKIYKVDDFFIVYQWNSDGAGAYEIAWVINKDGILQRLVGTIN